MDARAGSLWHKIACVVTPQNSPRHRGGQPCLEGVRVQGGEADGAVASLRSDTDAVELIGEVEAAVVVVGGEGPRCPGEILEAA